MNKALEKITLDSLDAEGNRWIIHTNGHFALCVRDESTAPTPDRSGLIAAALAAPTTTYPAHALRSIVPLPCEKCGDNRTVTCGNCHGTTKVERGCDRIGCNETHACVCECYEGLRACPACADPDRGGYFDASGAAFDSRYVAILIREMASAEEYAIGSIVREKEEGRALVIRDGKSVGVVMELRLAAGNKSRNYAKELAGVAV